MPVSRRNGFSANILHDDDGAVIDSILTAGINRLAVDALISAEIQIGAVEIDDGEGSTRLSVKADATAISAAPNDGGLLIAGRDGATQRHIRVNASGQLVVTVAGAAPLNTFVGAVPAFVTVAAASIALVAANAARKFLYIVVTSQGRRISLGLEGAAAVLDSGITVFNGQPAVFDAAALSTGAINVIASGPGTNVAIQEGS